jgi:hypothetical protein
MAEKKESSASWHQVSVVIRADILEQTRQQKIDISDVVNRALAERLGIDYHQQKIPEGTIVEPVIIASNETPALPDHVPVIPKAPATAAIINADDPLAAKTIKSRHIQKEKPAGEIPPPAPVPAPAPEKQSPSISSPSPIPGKAKKPAPKKKKDDAAKKFFASTILREDSETALIPKDDMYYAFERWCRNHRVHPVPDKKSFSVTLKNQFAVKEKMVNGSPTWVGVKVK